MSPDRTSLPAGMEGDPHQALLVDVVRVAPATEGDLEAIAATCAGTASVAVVRGRVADAAVELALSCTLIVATKDAHLVGGGARPPGLAGTAQRLARRLGAGGALLFWLDESGWSAEQACERGLVDERHEDAAGRAAELLALWQDSGGAARELTGLLARAGRLSPGCARAFERAAFALAFSNETARRGARRFFERS